MMSKRRKYKEISVTGVVNAATPISVEHSEALLDSLTKDNYVVIKGTSTEWRLSRGLLRLYLQYFHDLLKLDTIKAYYLPGQGYEHSFPLFIQWIYLRSYSERDGFVYSFSTKNYEYDLQKISPVRTTTCSTPWEYKAAILAWYCGDTFGSPQFKNYAMRRLFDVFSTSSMPFILDASNVSRSFFWGSKMPYQFLLDLIIRNWGDIEVVNHLDTRWGQVFNNADDALKFMRGVAIPLKERREQPMDIERYLIKED